jgi:glutaconate CoA-transferase subunit A
VEWAKISKDRASMQKYIDEWIYGVSGRKEYVEKLGADYVNKLKAKSQPSGSVNYGY